MISRAKRRQLLRFHRGGIRSKIAKKWVFCLPDDDLTRAASVLQAMQHFLARGA